MRNNHKVVNIVLLLLILFAPFSSQAIANFKEVIINGDFENGMVNFEIYKHPVYPDVVKIVRSASNVISGQYSLDLPHVNKGGYKFVLPMLLLDTRDSVKFSALISSKENVYITIEAFVRKKRVYRKHLVLKKNQKKFTHKLASRLVKTNSSPVSLVIWIKSKRRIIIDDVSLKTTGSFSDDSGMTLAADNQLGVYGINEKGVMYITGINNVNTYKYRIYDQIKNKLIVEGDVDNDKSMLNLYTDKRGSYRVELINPLSSEDNVLKWRLYSVINKDVTNLNGGGRYGIAMEEYGYLQFQNALIEPEDWYRLASQIGADSVRLFTAAMPDVVSNDGIYYDFSVSDKMLSFSHKYNLEPLVELGSNVPHRLPKWMLTVKANGNINLNNGLRTNYLKSKFEKFSETPYLDMKIYNEYLVNVMSHFGRQVSYYELWNEPGHKFKTGDFVQLARMTRNVQEKYVKHAQLVGFSSTKGKGFGKGVDANLLPVFISELLDSCSDCIDILSYHGEHAYQFLGFSIDHKNLETGYPERLRLILDKHHQIAKIPLWDTERGVKWFSPHTERIDYVNNVSGREMNESKRDSVSVNEAARKLPVLYAAAFSSGVEKLFWFYMNSGTMTSVRSHGRFGFFDANLEPMPHLPVYDAMTEIIADAEYVNSFDKPDGTRVYEFKRRQGNVSILLAYNWKEVGSTLSIRRDGAVVEVKDILGETTSYIDNNTSKLNINLNGWPQYIIITNTQ